MMPYRGATGVGRLWGHGPTVGVGLPQVGLGVPRGVGILTDGDEENAAAAVHEANLVGAQLHPTTPVATTDEGTADVGHEPIGPARTGVAPCTFSHTAIRGPAAETSRSHSRITMRGLGAERGLPARGRWRG